MKIVYVLNSAEPGGVEQHVLDLVRGMVARGHEVYVACPWGSLTGAYFEAGAEVRIDQPRIDIDPFFILRLVRFLQKIRPDILHVHQLKTVVNGLIAARFAKVPVKIAHIHTPLSVWQIPEWKKRTDLFINRLVSNWGADVVLALTNATKQERIEREGINPEKIVIIPNGVDLEKLKTQSANGESKLKVDYRQKLEVPEDVVLIGTLSRLTVEKGIRTLVEAVSLLNNKYQILIGGSGELREDLELRVRELGVEDKARFLGFIPDEEKFLYLSALDIFVFPSLAEGFGISLIEAMACSCACVASDLSVLSEVGGRAVEIFKVGNSKDLAEKLAKLISDSEHRELLGRAARERVEKEFTMEKFEDRYEKLYESLLTSGAKSR